MTEQSTAIVVSEEIPECLNPNGHSKLYSPRLGMPVDEAIFSTVDALARFGIVVPSSCQGEFPVDYVEKSEVNKLLSAAFICMNQNTRTDVLLFALNQYFKNDIHTSIFTRDADGDISVIGESIPPEYSEHVGIEIRDWSNTVIVRFKSKTALNEFAMIVRSFLKGLSQGNNYGMETQQTHA